MIKAHGAKLPHKQALVFSRFVFLHAYIRVFCYRYNVFVEGTQYYDQAIRSLEASTADFFIIELPEDMFNLAEEFRSMMNFLTLAYKTIEMTGSSIKIVILSSADKNQLKHLLHNEDTIVIQKEHGWYKKLGELFDETYAANGESLKLKSSMVALGDALADLNEEDITLLMGASRRDGDKSRKNFTHDEILTLNK